MSRLKLDLSQKQEQAKTIRQTPPKASFAFAMYRWLSPNLSLKAEQKQTQILFEDDKQES
jgi:hypothetical protein